MQRHCVLVTEYIHVGEARVAYHFLIEACNWVGKLELAFKNCVTIGYINSSAVIIMQSMYSGVKNKTKNVHIYNTYV